MATSKVKKDSKAKARSKKADDKQKNILEMLKSHGAKIYEDLDNGQFPKFSIPSRSVSNIVYDKKLRQYILGNNAALRSSRNSAQLRSFTQLMWLAFFANRLTNEKKSSTLRDVYYSSQAFAVEFEDQSESDNIIVDLEAVTSKPREDFHIFPEERSSIFGDLNIEYTIPGYEGKTMNLSNHPDGYSIGPSLTTAELVDTSAEIVIAIEKGGLFTRFVEEQVDKKFKSIIINTGGQAPRSTRTLLKRLHDEMNLPIICLTDGDVYGEHIAMVIKSGSANAAHLRELTVDTSAEIVIAIEKGGLFTRFVEEQVDKKFKSIIINTGGQAPRSTRTLLKRLHDEMNLPIICLTDGDVYGEHIAMVIKSGSANAAHLRELTVPDAKWVGVWATDIEKYKLPTIPMTESDIKRCYDLQKDPRYQDGIWKKELDVFLRLKRKAELEAFSKYGLTNITDKYLPQKLELAKSL